MKRILVTLLILLAASPAMAMRSYTGWAQSDTGDRLYQAEIRVYLAGTEGATSAIIYSDDGITPMAQPILTDYHGKYRFYVADGTYDIKSSYGGSDTWLYDVQIVDHLQFKIDDAEFGAISGDGIDDAPAIQAAHDAAAAATPTGVVIVPPGDWDVFSTVTNSDQVAIKGEGFQSQLISHITDGSAVIENLTDDRVDIQDISIINYDANVTGNWIGVNLDCNRGYLSNVRVRRAAVGFQVHGWIWDMANLWAYYCTTGFSGTEFYSARANLNVEICTTGVVIDQGAGLQLTGVNESNGDGLVLDDVHGADICMYFEANTSSHILIGQTTTCESLVFGGSTFGGTSGLSIVDNVNGFDASGAHFTAQSPFYITGNALNVNGLPTLLPTSYGGSMYYLNNVRSETGYGTIRNYFTNPYFHSAIRGYDDVSYPSARTAFSVDSTNVINGGGLKVEATTTSGNVYVTFYMGTEIGTQLAGKEILAGGWCYIPDDDTNYPDTGTTDCNPTVILDYYDGAWNTTSAAARSWKNDGWTFFCRQVATTDSTTNVRLNLYSTAGGTPEVGAYVTWSGVFLVEAPADINDLMFGRWEMHPLAGREIGTRLEWPDTHAPTDAQQSYLVGDRVIHNTLIDDDTYLDWICTVAGSPGTWKYRQITLEP